ncbi:PIG-L family deacetylase [Candidatus Entotheonella palauensis]|uniref:PIG-L family deacetylase n=1 Tax=Candidatus Entotheonella palauensis TaxID=93172 RepID=UPI000B7CF026
MDNHRHRAVTVPASVARLHTQSWSPTAADSLALILRGLPVSACALMVGAHPDDEDTGLLADLALRHGVRAVYLSLTRGEGGQNRIGPETGAAFGILRTGELLASRLHDGGRAVTFAMHRFRLCQARRRCLCSVGARPGDRCRGAGDPGGPTGCGHLGVDRNGDRWPWPPSGQWDCHARSLHSRSRCQRVSGAATSRS